MLGESRFLYKHFFKVYDAKLYLAADSDPSKLLSGTIGFKLQFDYLRKIDKQLAIDSAQKALNRNLKSDQQAQIAERLNALNAAYRSVEKGDYSILHFEPGYGTHYIFNGEKLTTIPGDDFARLYFTIWLGEQPLSTPLRDALLGNS